ACAATVAAALFQLIRWIERPNGSNAVLLGVAVGVALLSKFSSLPFLGVCFLAVLIYRAFIDKTSSAAALKIRAVQFGVAALVTLILLLAMYRFTTGPVIVTRGGKVLASITLPLVDMTSGIRTVYKHDKYGHDSYLLGEYRRTGWWYFFPLVLAVKTPIGF